MAEVVAQQGEWKVLIAESDSRGYILDRRQARLSAEVNPHTAFRFGQWRPFVGDAAEVLAEFRRLHPTADAG